MAKKKFSFFFFLSFFLPTISSSLEKNKQKKKTIQSQLMISETKTKKKKKICGAYDIWYSRVVTLPSTDQTSTCLISVSGTGTDAFRCVWPQTLISPAIITFIGDIFSFSFSSDCNQKKNTFFCCCCFVLFVFQLTMAAICQIVVGSVTNKRQEIDLNIL